MSLNAYLKSFRSVKRLRRVMSWNAWEILMVLFSVLRVFWQNNILFTVENTSWKPQEMLFPRLLISKCPKMPRPSRTCAFGGSSKATYYSQLSPCGHLAITDTPIKRTAAKSQEKTNYRRLTEIKSRYYGLSLMRTLTRGPYGVRYKGSWLYSLSAWHLKSFWQPCIILTKREVKMAGCWTSLFLFIFFIFTRQSWGL